LAAKDSRARQESGAETMARHSILVIGSMNFDSFYTLPHPMRLGENLHATDYQTACGGKGANQAVQCAKLGIKTYMLGCLGSDAQGDRIHAEMTRYCVDMSLVRRADTPTGNASVWVYPAGDVQAALYGGANMCVTKADIDRALPMLAQTAIVIVQNEIPMEVVAYAIDAAKAAGCVLLYNAAPALSVSDVTLRMVDYLIVNEAEASFYSGISVEDEATARQAAQALLPQLRGKLIVTLGAKGSLIAGQACADTIPALSVNAVETTGAGDSFVGGLAYGLLEGCTLAQAAALATRAAAITVSAVGAQPSMPTLAMLLKSPI